MFSLPMLEISRFQRALITKLALLVVVLIPTLYAGVYLSANWNPTDNIDQLTAAVVNNDHPATSTGSDDQVTEIHAGADLVDKLVDSNDAGFTWVEADAQDAQRGLDDGRYNAVLTIPSDLSTSIASFGDDTPFNSQLDISTNDAQNYIVGNIASTVLDRLSAQLDSTVLAQYLDQVYVGFNTIHSNLGEAVDGSAELADGSNTLHSGLVTLNTGAQKLRDGAQQLRDGLSTAVSGSSTLTDGAGQVANGTATLAAKADEITAKVDEIAPTIDSAIDPLAADAQTLVDGVSDHATEAEGLATALRLLADANPDDTKLADLATRAEAVAAAAADIAANTEEVHQRISAVSDRAHSAVSDAQAKVAEADSQINRLNDGASQVAGGASELHSGLVKLADGSSTLYDGTITLVDGTTQAESGSGQLASGASQLADGLKTGVAKIPTYSNADRDHRSNTVAAPVDAEATRQNAVTSYGEGLAPFFLSVSLWVGGMITYMVLRASPVRAYASRMRSWRIAVAGYLPGLFFAILQSLVVCLTLFWGLGMTPPNPWLFLAFATLVSVSFAAVHHMLVSVFGSVGRLVALFLLVLQLGSAGGTYPIETSPSFYVWLHPFMPLSYSVAGFRALMAGTDLMPAVSATGFLVLLIPLSLLISTFAAHRKRMWSVTRLHPSLEL